MHKNYSGKVITTFLNAISSSVEYPNRKYNASGIKNVFIL